MTGANQNQSPVAKSGVSKRGTFHLARQHLPAAGISLVAIALLRLFVTAAETNDQFAAERKTMVRNQIERRGVTNQAVLDAMRRVPRHEFVELHLRSQAYEDYPLPIGHGQTISQPYIVALMTELLNLKPGQKVLEIGTGSGYQAAVLAEITTNVYTIEIVEPLARRAEADLKRLGCTNVHVRTGDGYQGWPEAAPFDAIIVTCAPDRVPQPLVDQLKEGGRLVIPVGEAGDQSLCLLQKQAGKVERRAVLPVRFVPMTGGPPKP